MPTNAGPSGIQVAMRPSALTFTLTDTRGQRLRTVAIPGATNPPGGSAITGVTGVPPGDSVLALVGPNPVPIAT